MPDFSLRLPTGRAAAMASSGVLPPDDAVRWRRWGAGAGLLGAALLISYFALPALIGLPSADISPDRLIAYADAHQLLFYLGGWLQVTGAVFSVLFFLTLLQMTGRRQALAGAVTLTGAALLLAAVTIEAALLEAVPMAATAADRATAMTGFALSNGVFARIFPLAPAPLLFAGIGTAMCRAGVLPPFFVRSALAIAALFFVSGLAAVFGPGGLIFASVMSVAEALWIPAAAITLALTRAATTPVSNAELLQRQ